MLQDQAVNDKINKNIGHNETYDNVGSAEQNKSNDILSDDDNSESKDGIVAEASVTSKSEELEYLNFGVETCFK